MLEILIVSFGNAVCICFLATALLNLLESKLPADFKKKFGLSWNLVKASVGSERGRGENFTLFSQGIHQHISLLSDITIENNRP